MKNIFLSFLLIGFICVHAFGQSHKQEVVQFQEKLNEEFSNPEESPLTKKERRKFKGHAFFPIKEKYRIEAKFVRIDDAVPFQMKTSTSRLPTYEKYGEAIFELEGVTIHLGIYQSHRLRQMEEHKNHLFLPFTDLTNGEETYGGGRYVDLKIPTGDTIIIDFNKAYSPTCAYNHGYSCPIPPKENDMNNRIAAGVKNLEL